MTDDAIEDAIESIYVNVDEALRLGRFHLVDQLLSTVSLDAPMVLLLAYLSITQPARERLPIRPWLYAQVRARAYQERAAREAAALLRGFEP